MPELPSLPLDGWHGRNGGGELLLLISLFPSSKLENYTTLIRGSSEDLVYLIEELPGFRSTDDPSLPSSQQTQSSLLSSLYNNPTNIFPSFLETFPEPAKTLTMHAKIALIAAVAGAAAATNIHPERVRRDILARQTDLPDYSSDPCMKALATVYASAPTPPPEIVSYEMTAPPQTDPCSITVPAELSAEYSSYTSQILSWVGANSASIESALSQCSTLTDMATEIPVCTSIGGGSGGAGGASSGGSDSKPTQGSKEETPAGTGTAAGASKTGSGSASKVSGNAGPRETAMMAAAAAAAGFVGVAAFL